MYKRIQLSIFLGVPKYDFLEKEQASEKELVWVSQRMGTVFGVRGQKLIQATVALLLLWTLKRDHQRRIFLVICLEHCVPEECEPCGVVIQMAYLTQAEGFQTGG